MLVVAEAKSLDFVWHFLIFYVVDVEILEEDRMKIDFGTLGLASGTISMMASTFSWWYACINNAVFVYSVNEIVPHHQANSRKFNADDYYLPHQSKVNGLELKAELEVGGRK